LENLWAVDVNYITHSQTTCFVLCYWAVLRSNK